MAKKKQHTKSNNLNIIVIGCIALVIVLGGLVFMQSKNTTTLNYTAQSITDTVDLIERNWQYHAGVEKTDKGLEVHPIQRIIAEQDGSVAQQNPPINLAGTYIEKLKGNFRLDAEIDLQESKNAVITLYGQPPVIADEFRIERERLSMTISRDTLAVTMWDGKSEQPIVEESFAAKAAQLHTLQVVRKNGTIVFRVNNESVGSVPESGIFTQNTLWFGLSADDSSWILRTFSLTPIDTHSLTVSDAATLTVKGANKNSLYKKIKQKRHDFVVGSAMALGPMVSDKAYARTALTDFNGMTPENDMKMINLQPQRGVYTFSQADGLLQIAKDNGLLIHGHTLVFGEANPDWVTNLPANTPNEKADVEKVMLDHIQTVVSHYKGIITSWDVINEPLADADTYTQDTMFRDHIWYKAMGEEYIIKALSAAHRADPEAILFINEYGLEFDGERWDAMYSFLVRLKPLLEEQGIPVDKVGIGFQAHVYERRDQIDPQLLLKHIQQLAELGYISQVSEMDVYSSDGDDTQSKQYSDVLQACLTESSCIAWRIWILSDKYNYWKDQSGQIQQGKDGLYDTQMNPRPARKALERF